MDTEDTPEGPNKKGLYRFLAGILMVFGLFFIIPSQFEINQATEASDWLPRRAKITHSNLMQFGGGRGQDLPHFVPDIGGVFLDTGEAFDVYRVSFAEISHKTLAERYINRFAKGSIVDVYVSPEDPEKVVLIRDVPLMWMYLLQVVGGVLMAIAIFLLFKAWRLRK